MMDAQKDEIGRYLPLTFPKRMFIFVTIVVFVNNFVVFYVHEKNSMGAVPGVSIIEIVAMVIFVALFVPMYQRAGARVRW
jgi:hypothetical protein